MNPRRNVAIIRPLAQRQRQSKRDRVICRFDSIHFVVRHIHELLMKQLVVGIGANWWWSLHCKSASKRRVDTEWESMDCGHPISVSIVLTESGVGAGCIEDDVVRIPVRESPLSSKYRAFGFILHLQCLLSLNSDCTAFIVGIDKWKDQPHRE